MQTIYHKKNEKQEIEFFQDKECTIPFDPFNFTNPTGLYIELKDGDVTPLFQIGLLQNGMPCTWVPSIFSIFTPYIPNTVEKVFLSASTYKCGYKISFTDGSSCQTEYNIKTLDDITPNLSKYIPEDNAVLFLSEEDSRRWNKKGNIKYTITCSEPFKGMPQSWVSLADKQSCKITIFLTHGTQTELENETLEVFAWEGIFQKANEVAKELKEKYGVEEVNLFALHWFGSEYQKNSFEIEYFCQDFGTLKNINKIITTNSTGILKPEDSNERLQVIDCKEIFKEYLKTEK